MVAKGYPVYRSHLFTYLEFQHTSQAVFLHGPTPEDACVLIFSLKQIHCHQILAQVSWVKGQALLHLIKSILHSPLIHLPPLYFPISTTHLWALWLPNKCLLYIYWDLFFALILFLWLTKTAESCRWISLCSMMCPPNVYWHSCCSMGSFVAQ